MVYCCVPFCRSRPGKSRGVSFHQFPSDRELCAKWQRNIARKDLYINDKSPSTVVCSQHFLPTDYATGCRIKKLLPGSVPTLFEDYPADMIPPAKRPRIEPVSLELPAKQINREAQPLPAAALSASVEYHEDTKSVSTQTTNSDHQRASRHLSTISRLRSQVAYHRSKSRKLLDKLAKEEQRSAFYRGSKHHASLRKIEADSRNGHKKAVFLLHQIARYEKQQLMYPEEVIRECVIWRFVSPKGYDHARSSGLLNLPAKCTLQKYMGPSPTTSGMSAAMRTRLVYEASLLSSRQHMASLIIDEASIKAKCIYDRKGDAVFGFKDRPDSSSSNTQGILANRVLCFVLCGTNSQYKIPCSYYFTKQLSGKDLFQWTKEVIAAVESCGFNIVRIVTDNYSANTTLFKHMGNGSLRTVVTHPHDSNRVIFLSFDPCHVIKNIRSQFLERQLTDGCDVISGTYVQKLYEYQKPMTVKLARNLTRKHVYPTNLEKQNVLRAVQVFSPQVCAALQHLQENYRGDRALNHFKDAGATIRFMKTVKEWFDMHDTSFAGSGYKAPICSPHDNRLLWLENTFTVYIKNVQSCSVASGKGALTEETFEALLFTTQSTVETTRFLLQEGVRYVLTKNLNSDPVEALFGRIRQMCGGNDQLDARAVTAALDRIVKAKALCTNEAETPDIDAEEVAATLSEKFHDELQELTQCQAPATRSVTYSGLSYVGGYIAKLITDFGCGSCEMLVTTCNKDNPLYALLQGQDRSGLCYPRPEFLALLNNLINLFERVATHLPRTNTLQVLQLLVECRLERAPILSCPECVDDSHAKRSAALIAEKFMKILLINHTKKITDSQDKPPNYAHKPSRKLIRL